MTENQKAWLKALYDEEIRQAAGAAENEKIWCMGSPDDTARQLHAANAEENLEYVKILERLKAQVDDPRREQTLPGARAD